MDRLQEKTTAPYPPVGADGGQSLSQKPNQSIAEGVTEHKPPERDLEEILRQISRVNDPAYLPTVSMNDLYEQVYPGRPPVVDGLLYARRRCARSRRLSLVCIFNSGFSQLSALEFLR